MRQLIFCLLLLQITPVHAIELGQGFLSAEDLWTPQCVKGKTFFGNNQLGVLEAEFRHMNSKTFFNQVFKTSAGIDLGIIGADGDVTVDQTLSKDDRSWYLVITYQITKPTEFIRQIELNEFGKKAFRYSNSENFKNYCGDQYLSDMQHGTKVHIVAKYDFKETIIGTTFKFKVSLKIAGKKISKTITKSATHKNELKNYSQFVIVDGGNSGQIKGEIQTMMAACDPHNIETCDKTIDQLVEFINSETFLEQVTQDNTKAYKKTHKPYPANLFHQGEL